MEMADMNMNLLNPATTERVSNFYDNVIYFFVCLPLVLSCLKRNKNYQVGNTISQR